MMEEGLQGGKHRSGLYPQLGILGFRVTVQREHLWFRRGLVSAALLSSLSRNPQFGKHISSLTHQTLNHKSNPSYNSTTCRGEISERSVHGEAERGALPSSSAASRSQSFPYKAPRSAFHASHRNTQLSVSAAGTPCVNADTHSCASAHIHSIHPELSVLNKARIAPNRHLLSPASGNPS